MRGPFHSDPRGLSFGSKKPSIRMREDKDIVA